MKVEKGKGNTDVYHDACLYESEVKPNLGLRTRGEKRCLTSGNTVLVFGRENLGGALTSNDIVTVCF